MHGYAEALAALRACIALEGIGLGVRRQRSPDRRIGSRPRSSRHAVVLTDGDGLTSDCLQLLRGRRMRDGYDGPERGRPRQRLEDFRFLTGLGRYVDDLSEPGQLF